MLLSGETKGAALLSAVAALTTVVGLLLLGLRVIETTAILIICCLRTLCFAKTLAVKIGEKRCCLCMMQQQLVETCL